MSLMEKKLNFMFFISLFSGIAVSCLWKLGNKLL